MAPLAPLAEEPGNEDDERRRSSSKAGLAAFHRWARARLPLLFFASGRHPATADLRILLSVLACPLSPVPVQRRLPRHVASSAQYIMQQFRATTGCAKIEGGVKSMYAAGRVRLAMLQEPSNNGRRGSAVAASGRSHHEGCFVMWQLVPDMWLVELAIAGHPVAAGSDGRVAWRRTPWVGAHAARGGPRPLRRALQASIVGPILHDDARICMHTLYAALHL